MYINIANKLIVILIICIFVLSTTSFSEQIPINNNLSNVNDIALNNIQTKEETQTQQKLEQEKNDQNIQNNNINDNDVVALQFQETDLTPKQVIKNEKSKAKMENEIVKEMKVLVKEEKKAKKLNYKMRMKEEKKFPRDMKALAKRDKKNKAALSKMQKKIAKIQLVRGTPVEQNNTVINSVNDENNVDSNDIKSIQLDQANNLMQTQNNDVNVFEETAKVGGVIVGVQTNKSSDIKDIVKPSNESVNSLTTSAKDIIKQEKVEPKVDSNNSAIKKTSNQVNKTNKAVVPVAVKKKNNSNKQNNFKNSIKFTPMFVIGTKQLTKECEWEIEQLVEKLNNDQKLNLVVEVRPDKKRTANDEKLLSQRAQEIAIKLVNEHRIKNKMQIKKVNSQTANKKVNIRNNP